MSDELTLERIAKLRMGITAPPWSVAGGVVVRGGSAGTQEAASLPLSLHDNSQAKIDAEFIAASPAIVDWLMAEVASLTAKLEEARAEIKRLNQASAQRKW